jgi:hypothetical protein
MIKRKWLKTFIRIRVLSYHFGLVLFKALYHFAN